MRLKKLKTQEVLSRSIGIGLYNGMVNFIIPRNTQLPYSSEFTFSKELAYELYEGERPHIKYCKYIGKLKLKKPTGQYSNMKILINIDNEGLLTPKCFNRDNLAPIEASISFDESKARMVADDSSLNPSNLELDPIEADRFKNEDITLNKSLDDLNSFLINLRFKYSKNLNIMNKVAETKNWIFKHRLTINVEQCKSIKNDIQEFINSGNFD